jgi:peptidyl-dipeptidase Dcp
VGVLYVTGKKKNMDLYDYPLMFVVMYADNRELARRWLSLWPKVFKTMNWTTNKMYLKLNCVLIELLGYTNHADFVLEERMAESPEVKHSQGFIRKKQNQLP